MATKRKKTKYNQKELKEFEAIIDDKLLKAQENLDYYLAQIQDIANNPDSKLKGLDDASTQIQNERLYTMAARQRKLLQYLGNAKLRIMNGVYGICRESGNLISKDRLKAVPHATLSITAKQKQLKR